MNIIEEVKKVGIDANDYIVVGSGHLTALGLKQGHDIDMVVRESTFNRFIILGWEKVKFTYPESLGQVFLRKENIELYLSVGMPDFDPTFDELFQRSVLIDGVRFASLGDILNLKKCYLKNNPKHGKDIGLIEGLIH